MSRIFGIFKRIHEQDLQDFHDLQDLVRVFHKSLNVAGTGPRATVEEACAHHPCRAGAPEPAPFELWRARTTAVGPVPVRALASPNYREQGFDFLPLGRGF